jgi:hypothetical protein
LVAVGIGLKVKILGFEVAALYPVLAALVTVTAHFDSPEVFVVVNLSPEITHPGLLVEKLTAPSPEPPFGCSKKLSLRNLIVMTDPTVNKF